MEKMQVLQNKNVYKNTLEKKGDKGNREPVFKRNNLFFIFLLINENLLISHSVQSHGCVQLFETPWTTAQQASLSISNFQSLLKLLSIESVMPSNHLILCCPLLILPSISHSIRVFSNELVLYIKWPKYWSPCNEYSGLISFRIDWFDLLAVQGTVKSSPTPQFKNINFSTLSFIYCPTLTSIHDYWKNHSLD